MGAPGNNAASLRNTISERREAYWYRMGMRYNLNYASDRARRSESPIWNGYEGPPGLWHEPTYVQSRYFRRERYLADFANRTDGPVLELQTVRCRYIIHADHTGPAARKMGSVGGKRAAYIMNEKNEIAPIPLVASDATENIREMVVVALARREDGVAPLAAGV